MRATTIKVDTTVRDRLAVVATERGLTLGALLDEISRRLETEQRWRAIEISYERLRRDDPDGWQDYLAELRDAVAPEPDTAAAEEWPEYNGLTGSSGPDA